MEKEEVWILTYLEQEKKSCWKEGRWGLSKKREQGARFVRGLTLRCGWFGAQSSFLSLLPIWQHPLLAPPAQTPRPPIFLLLKWLGSTDLCPGLPQIPFSSLPQGPPGLIHSQDLRTIFRTPTRNAVFQIWILELSWQSERGRRTSYWRSQANSVISTTEDMPSSTKVETPQAAVPVSFSLRRRPHKRQCPPHHKWNLLIRNPLTLSKAKGSRGQGDRAGVRAESQHHRHPHQSPERNKKAWVIWPAEQPPQCHSHHGRCLHSPKPQEGKGTKVANPQLRMCPPRPGRQGLSTHHALPHLVESTQQVQTKT